LGKSHLSISKEKSPGPEAEPGGKPIAPGRRKVGGGPREEKKRK